MSLSALIYQLTEVLCVDYINLNGVTLFYVMDMAIRYYAPYFVQSTNLAEVLLAFESCWLSQFWSPSAVHAKTTFWKEEYDMLMTIYVISLRPVPPNRHQKNVFEPLHGPNLSIFIRLQQAKSQILLPVPATRFVRV